MKPGTDLGGNVAILEEVFIARQRRSFSTDLNKEAANLVLDQGIHWPKLAVRWI